MCWHAAHVAVWLAEKQVRLRRAGRRDRSAVLAVLAADPRDRRTRFDRRLFADLGADVYVAETRSGQIVGALAVCYPRSLASGRFQAWLDTLRVETGHDELLGPMLDFVERRARRRGCRELFASPGLEDSAAGPLLQARGWMPRATLSRALGD